jgi:hypothetical protein
MICNVDQEIGENLRKFEEKPVASTVSLCFLHKPSGKYLGFNTEKDALRKRSPMHPDAHIISKALS